MILAGIVMAQIIVLVIYRPYNNTGTIKRPILNSISTTLILILYLIPKYVSKSISIYSPIAIVSILVICLAYNIIFCLKQDRKVREMIQV